MPPQAHWDSSKASAIPSSASQSSQRDHWPTSHAGDNLGAVAGPLLAAGLIASIGIRPAMYVAAVPGVVAAAAITIAARQAHASLPTARRTFSLHLRRLTEAGLLRPMIAVAAFEFGNVATTLLILRAVQELQSDGLSLTAAAWLGILIYAAHNAFGAVVAAAGGVLD